jgi:hypothetical protein
MTVETYYNSGITSNIRTNSIVLAGVFWQPCTLIICNILYYSSNKFHLIAVICDNLSSVILIRDNVNFTKS